MASFTAGFCTTGILLSTSLLYAVANDGSAEAAARMSPNLVPKALLGSEAITAEAPTAIAITAVFMVLV